MRVEEKGARVEAESVALVEEAEVAEPVVRLPVAVKGMGSKKRRVDGSEDEEEEDEKREEVLIAPLGPRAECGGLLRRVGKESVFVLGMPRLWYIPTDLYEAHRPSTESTRSYLTTHNRQGLA